MKFLKLCLSAILVGSLFTLAAAAQEAVWPSKTHYKYQEVNGNQIFYREAGTKTADVPTLVLLHGYPTSSHYFRELIPLLSGRYHVIAPDNLGSGFSDLPDPATTTYTFDLLADHVEGLLDTLQINQAIYYIHDFGAPVGFRVMMRNPGRLKGIIAQNGNAYSEGVPQGLRDWFKQVQSDRSPQRIKETLSYQGPESVKGGYMRGLNGKEHIMSPDTWTHDNDKYRTENGRMVQVHLFQDYYNNLNAYPQWQAFLRDRKPPTLLVWGKHDQTFIAPGAEAFLKDNPGAELNLLNAEHFALEEMPVEIAKLIVNFVEKMR